MEIKNNMTMFAYDQSVLSRYGRYILIPCHITLLPLLSLLVIIASLLDGNEILWALLCMFSLPSNA